MSSARREHIEADQRKIDMYDRLVKALDQRFNLGATLAEALTDYFTIDLWECMASHTNPKTLLVAVNQKNILQDQISILKQQLADNPRGEQAEWNIISLRQMEEQLKDIEEDIQEIEKEMKL